MESIFFHVFHVKDPLKELWCVCVRACVSLNITLYKWPGDTSPNYEIFLQVEPWKVGPW